MSVRFSCPCGQKVKTNEEVVGKRARCPTCHQWLRVPMSDDYDTVAEKAPPPKKEREGAPSDEQDFKARLVVADSRPDDLKETIRLLEEHGYKVYACQDGTKALDTIRQVEPDGVVLDMRLDAMSGFQVVQHLHNPSNTRNEKVWKTPVFMTTEKLRGRDKQYAISLGVKGFFAKPLVPAQVCSRLEKELHGTPGLHR